MQPKLWESNKEEKHLPTPADICIQTEIIYEVLPVAYLYFIVLSMEQ